MAGVKSSEILVYGTLPSAAGGFLFLNYPEGFAFDNCMIESSMYFYNNETWASCNEIGVQTKLGMSTLTIVLPNPIPGNASYVLGRSVKVLLKKLTNDMYVHG